MAETGVDVNDMEIDGVVGDSSRRGTKRKAAKQAQSRIKDQTGASKRIKRAQDKEEKM